MIKNCDHPSITLHATRDYLVVPVGDLAPGTYLCSLLLANKPIQSARIIIAK